MNFRDVYNPTRGVKEDFNQLLETFSSQKTVRYEHFAELWKSMKFSFLYAGRKNDRECREFYEEVNHIALSFHLLPYDFQVRTGGLYILYGLYFTQPCVPKIPIRVTNHAWNQIMDFQKCAHSQKHYDVEYVFQKLFREHAFLFVATPNEVYIKSRDKIQVDKGGDSNSLTRDSLRIEDSVSTVFTPDILQQLRAIHMQYQQIKLGIAGPNALRPDRSLDVVEDEIMHSIDNRLVQHTQRLEKIRSTQRGRQWKPSRVEHDTDDGESSDNPDDTPVPKSGQARVKAQAYAQQAQQVKYRRHRTVLTQNASESSPDKPIRKGQRKVKSIKGDEDVYEYESQLTSNNEESSDQLLSPVEYLSMPTLDMDVVHTSGPTTESDLTKKTKDGLSKSCPSEKGPSTSKTNPSKIDTDSFEAETDCSKSETTTSKISKKSSKKSKKTPTKSVLSKSPDSTSPAKVTSTPKAKSGKVKRKPGIAAQQKVNPVKKRRQQSGAGDADGAPAAKVEKSSPAKTTPSKTSLNKESVTPKIVYKPV